MQQLSGRMVALSLIELALAAYHSYIIGMAAAIISLLLPMLSRLLTSRWSRYRQLAQAYARIQRLYMIYLLGMQVMLVAQSAFIQHGFPSRCSTHLACVHSRHTSDSELRQVTLFHYETVSDAHESVRQWVR